MWDTFPEAGSVVLCALVRASSKKGSPPKGRVDFKLAMLQATAAGHNSTRRGRVRTRHFDAQALPGDGYGFLRRMEGKIVCVSLGIFYIGKAHDISNSPLTLTYRL